MTVNREIWQESFWQLPAWPCPRCEGAGRLVLVPDTLKEVETVASKAVHGEDWWDPDMSEVRFTAHMACSSSECGEGVAVAGISRIEEVLDFDHDRQSWESKYYPTTVAPPPLPIDVPEDTPQSVGAEIRVAASLIWVDIGSSANKLRSAAEKLLDALRVPKTEVTRRGRVRRTFANRLNHLQPQNPRVAELLHSIRFLGNVGSHEPAENLDREDLLSAFEIFELALRDLYDDTPTRVAKSARAIAKRRGRKARRKK